MANANQIRMWTLIAAFAWTAILGACDPSPPKVASPDVAADVAPGSSQDVGLSDAGPAAESAKIIFSEGESPGPDVVLVKSGELEVTLADYDKALKISRLMQPGSPKNLGPIAPERLAMPVAQFTTARGVLNRKMVAKEAAKRKIVVSEKDAIKWLKGDRFFKILGSIWDTPELDDALKTVGLTQDDILQLAKEEVSRGRLADKLVAAITEDEVWARYAFEMTTTKLAVAMARNVPSTKELSEFVASNDEAIKTYFKENSRTFRVPKRVRVDILASPRDATSDRAVLEKAARMLKSGKKPAEVTKELGLEIREDVGMVKQQNAKAFRSEAGDAGFTMESPRGAYAWVVRGFDASHLPELDRALTRQVAAEMMRRDGLTPATQKKLKAARKILRRLKDGSNPKKVARAKAKIEALKLQFEIIGPFDKSPNGSIPKFGLAPEVVEAAFKLTTRRRTVKKPIYSRERGFVIHLLERTEPSRETFNESKESFVERYRSDARASIVERYVQSKLAESKPTFDLNALTIKYGTLEK